MNRGADDLAQSAWRALLRTHRRVARALDADLSQRGGIPLRTYEVLERLARAPGGAMRMSELATSVLMSASGITRLVDQLVERQLLERRPDPSDARVAIARLTREGRGVLRRTDAIYCDGVKRHFAAHLSEDDLNAIADALERLLAAGDAMRPPPEPRRARNRRS